MHCPRYGITRSLQAVDDAKFRSSERGSRLIEEQGTDGAPGSAVALPWYKGDKSKFAFLVRAYEPQYFWFELVDYGKKFLLSGVLIFCAPGSVSQAFFGLRQGCSSAGL